MHDSREAKSEKQRRTVDPDDTLQDKTRGNHTTTNHPHGTSTQPAEDPQRALRTAVKHLYEVFAPYDRLSEFVGCACGTCVSAEANTAIHARPLPELSPADLKPVTSSTFVLTTDLKHLLPRMAELVAEGHRQFGGHHPAEFLFITAETFEGWNDWRTTWPEHEQQAVERYFFALWRATLARDPGEAGAGEVLHMAAQIFDDLGQFLTIWQSEVTISSVRHLGAFVSENLVDAALYHQLKSFWLRPRPQSDQVIRWLTDPATERGYWQEYQTRWTQKGPVHAYRETIPILINSLAQFRRSFHEIAYFLEMWWATGSTRAIRSLDVFIADHVNGLLTEGTLRHRYRNRRNPDPWEGREEDEKKVVAWLLKPETLQLLRAAEVTDRRVSSAVKQLGELQARWRS